MDQANFKKEAALVERNGYINQSLKEAQKLVGLRKFKDFLIELLSFVEFQQKRKEQGFNEDYQSFHTVFLGNAGVGKTTAARILAKMLYGLGIVDNKNVVEVSRSDLVSEYVGQTAIKTQNIIQKAMGGVLFIDEAYTLARGGDQDFGKESIDTLVKAMEDNRNNLVVILAGYTDEMEQLLNTNSGLRSRIANNVIFEDYNINELIEIAQCMLQEKNYKLEEGLLPHLANVLESKQLKGKTDIGNARMVRNIIELAIRKHAVNYESDSDKELDVLTAKDFNIVKNNFSLEKEFNNIIGNESIKELVRSLESQIIINNERKKFDLQKSDLSLHMVFKGSPGVGKTTFARIIAKLLKEIKVLKKGHLVEVDRSDLVAGYVGQTAIKTKEVIESAIGGVLFIDEAYSLVQEQDSFGKEAIDTLVKAMEDYREDLVVIVAGYTEDMDSFLQANQGLSSRFNIQLPFNDYSMKELFEIAVSMFTKKDYQLTHESCIVLSHILKKGIALGGNGRFVRNIVEQSIRFQSTRLRSESNLSKDVLQTITAEDLMRVKNSL
ncbi:stage V sporulation protein K [Bacillus thuringiensis serovar medellin]|uniref:Stage V sporulation protein K n=2 Tax=Bacillus thuringiensis TaxID=1428 RepID=A0A9X6RB29_BACTV|nr:AAA family ATPase [Bacillus thuringiensis]OUB88490.1 stage V sporulation protein K [Bacillus thuringiensis serovar medellin]